MKIFADKNILALESNFSAHGSLHFFDGRSVQQSDLVGADALLVRSITQVNETLLKGTNIRFIGTATSGIDHIDTAYLKNVGIHFVDAKGGNANAVVDYCFAALAYSAVHRNFSLSNSKIGIVGAGAVGGLLAAKLGKMGVEVLCCDPFLAESANEEQEYFSLQEVLDCDAISLHVPLNDAGTHPTKNLLGYEELCSLSQNAILINACRGGVVDEVALKRVLTEREDITAIFDVWADEPAIDYSLAELVDVATPHIAGYSAEAKAKATKMLAREFEKHFDLVADVEDSDVVANLELVAVNNGSQALAHWQTVLAALAIDKLSMKFKQSLQDGKGAEAFDSFRQELLQRREFESVLLKKGAYTAKQQEQLTLLGFHFE